MPYATKNKKAKFQTRFIKKSKKKKILKKKCTAYFSFEIRSRN